MELSYFDEDYAAYREDVATTERRLKMYASLSEADKTIPVSVGEYFSLFLADDAPYSYTKYVYF